MYVSGVWILILSFGQHTGIGYVSSTDMLGYALDTYSTRIQSYTNSEKENIVPIQHGYSMIYTQI